MESSNSPVLSTSASKKPWGLEWRSSVWFATVIVGIGIGVDLLVYAIIIPVVPFQLQKLGYTNVSALSAFLLLAFSLGLVFSTPPISWLSERYESRRTPFILGLIALVGFLVMFMEAKSFWLMLVARFLQGISSSIVWVIGLALLCDTAPKEKAGQQLGLAMIGHTVGFMVAPPIGGALYDRFGFRAPFIFGMAVVVLDFFGRLLFIERKDAAIWLDNEKTDSQADTSMANVTPDSAAQPAITPITIEKKSQPHVEDDPERCKTEPQRVDAAVTVEVLDPKTASASSEPLRKIKSEPKHYTSLEVLRVLLTSSRTNASVVCIMIYAVAFTSLEPTLPLHAQELYNFDSGKAGILFLAIAIPAMISTPTAGWATDQYGVEYIVVTAFTVCIPFVMVMIIRSQLALFIVALVMSSFFVAGVISPLTAELAYITDTHDGIGYGHVYGAFNLAYGIGSAVGPVVAGQIYDSSSQGWTFVNVFIASIALVASIISFFFVGKRPLFQRLAQFVLKKKERVVGAQVPIVVA